MLGIGSNSDPNIVINDSSNSNSDRNVNVNDGDVNRGAALAGNNGSTGGYGNEQQQQPVWTGGGAALLPNESNSIAHDSHSTAMSSATTTTAPVVVPPLPPSSSPPTPAAVPESASAPPLHPLVSAPANVHIAFTTTQPTTAVQNNSNDNTTNAAAHPSTTGNPVMNQTQSDLMTMETFQPNGGSAYNHDAQEFTYPPQAGGPGSFPESYGANDRQYDYGSEVGTQGNDGGDDAYETNINFVYANEKRLSDFHALFRSVPEDEKLIEDYGCALQKEILVQGRLYISENYVCFNANIFGWVTNLVIAFSEITAIEKRLTAFVIPNAISISTTTNTKGHFFASFLSRDAAHDLLMAAWRKSFPCAANASAASNNVYFQRNRSNVTLNDDDTDTESFTSARPASDSRRNRHRRSSSASQNWTADEADWDETEDMDGKVTTDIKHRRRSKKAVMKKILKEIIEPILPDNDNHHEGHTGRPRSVSELPPPPSSFEYSGSVTNKSLDLNPVSSNGPQSQARPGSPPRSHANGAADGDDKKTKGGNRVPTTCKCSKDGRHYANTYMSETFPGSVESIWKLIFDSDFSKGFLTNEVMKGADVQEEAWQKADNGTTTKVTKYTKWLGMPIGPKTTKAILTDVCEHKDFDEYVTTVTTTSTPDVPSGNSFTTKCRTCITWAGPNQVKVLVTGAVEFTKSSWIKGQIEKGAAEGMTTHYKELNASMRKHIAAHPDEFSSGAAAASDGTASPKHRGHSSPRAHSHVRQQRAEGEYQSGKPSTFTEDASTEKASLSASASAPVTGTGATSGKTSGVWSTITDVFTSCMGDGESVSHLALVAVLLLVMVANIYIWLQISHVTSQIERMQDNMFSHRSSSRDGVRAMHKSSGNENNPFADIAGGLGDEGYTQEQEEAMWAWLTEREERHRRYQQGSAKDWIRTRKTGSADRSYDDDDKQAALKDFSATEAKLQARINDLQQQLETLEKAVDLGSHGM
ncbi:hypothetical protein BGZ54_009329 [Gamsiella multidivaricata]|nr:hypothetical protein BGZ54_009329 [Gamsiella multidivaricata]